MDWERLDATVRTAVTFLDRVVDVNYYPTEQAHASNSRWRPVGLGLMGLQDVFFRLRLPFDSDGGARAVHADLRADHARRLRGVRATSPSGTVRCPAWDATRTARGVLHPDHYPDAVPRWPERWDGAARPYRPTGLRNSLLLAIAPTATIASIAGVYECIEPQVSNLFKRETLSAASSSRSTPTWWRTSSGSGVWDAPDP